MYLRAVRKVMRAVFRCDAYNRSGKDHVEAFTRARILVPQVRNGFRPSGRPIDIVNKQYGAVPTERRPSISPRRFDAVESCERYGRSYVGGKFNEILELMD